MRSLCLPATLDSLDAIGKYIVAATTEAGLEDKPAYGLRLAVDEIATNIITHGYEEAGKTGTITVSKTLTDLTLTIVLEDSGIHFDPLSRKLPDEHELHLPLEEREIGGLGLFLVLKGVDEFRYEYDNGHNYNIFVMHRPMAAVTECKQ